MIRVKDIIARRRPPTSAEEAVAAEAPASPAPLPAAAADEAPVPQGKDESDLAKARQGRDARPWRLPDADWTRDGTDDTPAPEPMAPAVAPPAPAPQPVRRNIWDIDTAGDDPTASEPAPQPAPPRPEVLRAPSAAARNRTRLLGFHGDTLAKDVFQTSAPQAPTAAPRFPIGWVVVVEGPGRGASFTLLQGLSTIGRASDQTVSLDYGDASISRNNHASIAYDEEDNTVYVGHGGKSNIVRLNGRPLLSTEELQDGDLLHIGKTTLRYVAFCGPAFRWAEDRDAGAGDPLE